MSEVGKKIIEGLEELNAALESGDLSKVKVKKVTKDDLRVYLKSKGWRREDRAIGPNKSEELWIPPEGGFGITFRSALRRQAKADKQ